MAKKQVDEKNKLTEFELSIEKINKKFCGNSGKVIAKLKDAKALTMIKLPSGVISLDCVLDGGFNYRSIVEIYGEEHIGKSYLIQSVIANNQRRCYYCKELLPCNCNENSPNKTLYLDFEGSLYNKETDNIHLEQKIWLEKIGIDLDYIGFTQPKTWQKGIDYIIYSLEENLFENIVIDSITNAPNDAELEKDAEDATIALKAKANSLFGRKSFSALAPDDITDIRQAYKPIIFAIQQVNANMKGSHSMVNLPTIYGGHALKHYKHLSLQITNTGFINEKGTTWTSSKEEKCGRILRVKIMKDKRGDSYWQEISFRYFIKDIKIPLNVNNKTVLQILEENKIDTENSFIEFKAGKIDEIEQIFLTGIKLDIIKQSGAFYELSGIDKKIQGEENVKIVLYFLHDLRNNILKQIESIIYG